MSAQQDQWKDRERARAYAGKRGLASKLVSSPFARQAVAQLEPSVESPTIVELGAGPGFLAIDLARLRPQATIIGVDPSDEMLQIATENCSKAGLSSFESRQGTAEEMPLESGSTDLVVSQSSVHEWEEPRRALAEAYRVLRPGGSLVLKDYNLVWLSPWKRKLLGLLHPLHMFKFGYDDVVSMAADAGFEQFHGNRKGMQYVLVARKRKG